jgi:Required for nuclear transport of RNA pol II C-terminus 1
MLIVHLSLSVPVLYKTLTALLRPDAPEWFKKTVSEKLSMLPLRSYGVQWAIEFIATSFSTDKSSPKPVISHEALLQITQMLTSAPKRMTMESWLTNISSQLLELLDGTKTPELSQVAGFIITAGVLGIKSTGSPGSIGWKLFVQPQLNAFIPDQRPTASSNSDRVRDVLVSQPQLAMAMNRLWTLVSSNPSPSLTGRLIRPILLPLWGLYAYDKSPIIHPDWKNRALKLLEVFLKRCGTVDILLTIIHNLLWDGPSEWTFGPGSEGGLEIRARYREDDGRNMFSIASRVHGRVSAFVPLLLNDAFEGDKTVQLFLELIKPSLSHQKLTITEENISQSLLASEPDLVEELIRQQVIQVLLQSCGSRLVANPQQMLEFIDQILSQAVQQRIKQPTLSQTKPRPTLASLSTIVERQENNNTMSQEQSDDLLVTSISLLNIILDGPDFRLTDLESSRNILFNLDELSETSIRPVSVSTLSTINSARISLRSALESTNGKERLKSQASLQFDRDILHNIAKDLLSNIAPERTAAITALQRLIRTNTMTLDVPTVYNLLMTQIKNDSDEFVFLAAISALQSLAVAREPIFVIRNAVESFKDTEEIDNVDGRLRIGEALTTVIQSVMKEGTERQVTDIAKLNAALRYVAEITIVVASRRGKRRREEKEREKSKRIKNLKAKRDEKEWVGRAPIINPADEDTNDEELDEGAQILRDRNIQLAQSILNTWEDTGFEEDVRIRSSALSILGDLLEAAPSAFTPELLEYSMEIARSILYLEQQSGKEILRRAAVNVYISQLQVVISATESKKDTQSNRMNWLEIGNTLDMVKNSDEDELTREYASTALDGIESWKMSNLLTDSDSFELGGIADLRGLRMDSQGVSTPKIEEID